MTTDWLGPDSPFAKAVVRFWICPVREHRGGDRDRPIRQTVEWRDGVAYCLTPGCDRNSTNTGPDDYPDLT